MATPSRLPSIRRPAGSPSKSRPISMIEGSMTSIPNFSNTAAEADISKKAKRRSLLPQFSLKGLQEEKNEGGSIREEEEIGSAENARPISEGSRGSVESLGRKGLEEESVPVGSRLARPVSMIPPRGASQFRGTLGMRSPTRNGSKDKDTDTDAARADSLAALTGATTAVEPAPKVVMPESGLKRTGSTRLPQTPRAAGPVIPSRTTSTGIKHAHSRTMSKVNRTAGGTIPEDRTSSHRARPTSVYGTTVNQTVPDASTNASHQPSMMSRARPTSQMPQRTSPPPASLPSLARPQSQMPPPPAKPGFNTYQQHYSPTKSALPKPPIPPRTHAKIPSSTDTDTAASFEVTKQQIELLQLSLLHQSSAKCLQEYATSGKRKLGRMHAKLRRDYESVRATELVHQRAANLSALEVWCPDPAMLVENLQILSLVYSDLTSLIDEGSRHADVTNMFELWMNEAESPEPGAFIQPLPEDWKTAHASLALKLRAIQRNLRVLPPVQPPAASSNGQESSGLEVVLKGCKTLVEEMLKELEVMGKLEKEILARERTRVEDEVKTLMVNGAAKREWIPAWQKM